MLVSSGTHMEEHQKIGDDSEKSGTFAVVGNFQTTTSIIKIMGNLGRLMLEAGKKERDQTHFSTLFTSFHMDS